jgi:hypothetical protein
MAPASDGTSPLLGPAAANLCLDDEFFTLEYDPPIRFFCALVVCVHNLNPSSCSAARCGAVRSMLTVVATAVGQFISSHGRVRAESRLPVYRISAFVCDGD